MSTKIKLQAQSVFTTLLIGACGALVAWWLGVPAPFLTGPATVVSIAGLLGVNCTVPTPLRNACLIAIGLALGSSVTPEILSAASAWPVSLIGMCISVAIVMLSGGLMFQRIFGIERKTALLASSPGHLSYVIGFSADIQADTAIISVIQSMRVLILTLVGSTQSSSQEYWPCTDTLGGATTYPPAPRKSTPSAIFETEFEKTSMPVSKYKWKPPEGVLTPGVLGSLRPVAR